MISKISNSVIKHYSIIILCLILFIISLSIITINSVDYQKSSITNNPLIINENKGEMPLTSQYTLVDPINISSPGDWSNYSFINGTGTDLDPYIIENIEIRGSGVQVVYESPYNRLNWSDAGIFINAAGRFIIRNCKISSISFGIHITVGASTGFIHHIDDVEISNCGLGIYTYWPHIALNISNCIISNCKWVTIKAPILFSTQYLYGGYGIWLRGDTGSIIDHCRIQDCSIAIVATTDVSVSNNQFINCGMAFDYSHGIPSYIYNTTVNGKPIGIFYGQDNLVLSNTDVSQFGQLVFISCDNLKLSNIQIESPCSIGLTIYSCFQVELNDITVLNQNIGLYIYGANITTDKLYTKDCALGFCLLLIADSHFTKTMTDNTDMPICIYSPLRSSTLEIERSTRFYIVDTPIYDKLQFVSPRSSFNISRSFISDLDIECFSIKIDNTYTYNVTDSDLSNRVNFILVSTKRYPRPLAIPGFLSFWFYITSSLGILSLIFLLQLKKRIKIL